MKAATQWSYAPYTPPLFDSGTPYICRVVPDKRSIHIEWLACGQAETYTVLCAPRGGVPEPVGQTLACEYTIEMLQPDTDYYFQVTAGESGSRVRLARTGMPVGVIVNYLHPEDDCYHFSGSSLCSPSMAQLPDGTLLAAMDVYESKAPQNLSLIFRSTDDGQSWHYVCELMPCFWPRIFVHQGEAYVLACSTEYGDLLISRSSDGGNTFAVPVALLRGSGKCDRPGVHKNPQPLVEYGGRIWTTLEWGAWATGKHAPMVMSAPVDSDLLDPASWAFSAPVPYDPTWPGTAKGDSAGNIEGTLAVFPDGKLYNVMRYHMLDCVPNYGLALVYQVNTDEPEAPLRYDRAIPFPGNHSKFEIQYDAQTGRYYAIVSRILSAACARHRNLLSLIESSDLANWRVVCDLIDYREADPQKIGFQYVDFFFQGADLLYLCRTAINGARNYHDSNQITFHRVCGFRNY